MRGNLVETPETDAALIPFLAASTDAAAETALEKLLVETISPVVKKVLQRKLRFYREGVNIAARDFADLENEILVFFISRLREIKSAPGGVSIPDVGAYSATIAYNVCNQYLRQKSPERARLKNKIRYALNQSTALDLWKNSQNVWLAGLEAWKRPEVPRNFSAIEPEISNHRRLSKYRGKNQDETDIPEFLKVVFELTGAPLELDELVGFTAIFLNVSERADESYDAEGNLVLETFASAETRHDKTYEQRAQLERLWTEIKQLPPAQRAALLLNLTDKQGRDVILLLPFTRIATIREIAAALEIPLERFLEIWNGLPLEDSKIAQLLGISRQQVINLRKSARERLRRRINNTS